MTSRPDILDLHDVGFLRDRRWILDGVDWRIGRGEHQALLGANGSGKTTLLRVLAGYLWPSRGVVRVLGEEFGRTDLRELRKRVGWVTTSLIESFPEDQTALDVVVSGIDASIGLWREFAGEEIELARVALEVMGADHLAGKRQTVLSHGECQRVLIARALVNQPDLLILDEPCVGLDPAAREHFLSDLARFAADEHAPTIIHVTHHIEEIAPFVSRALILREGKVLASGPIGNVCTDGVLSEAFGCTAEVAREAGRYRLTIRPRT